MRSDAQKRWFAEHPGYSSEKSREWRAKNPEKAREHNRKSKVKHRDKILAYMRERSRAERENHPEKCMWVAAKKRAKHLGLPFTITIDDVVIPERCPALDIPLFRAGGRACPNSPSLDRIVPALGYVPGNVAVISMRANTIKQDAASAEIRAVADWVEKREKEV